MELDRQPETTEYIKGECLYTIFQNEQELFSIVKIKIHDTNTNFEEKEIVVKGYFANLQEDTVYIFYGHFETHPKFGKQFNVLSYQTFIPDSEEGLIAYLSSDLFYGIGKKTAKKIVDQLGENAVTKILNDQNSLTTVPGLNKETADNLIKTLKENQGFEHVVIFLAKYNIGLKLAQKIYQQFKEEAIDILQEDPYQFVFEIDGFGFQTADGIAKQNGLAMNHPHRIGAGCIYILQKTIQDGHVYFPMKYCLAQVNELLQTNEQVITEDDIVKVMEQLNKEKKLIIQNGNVYLPSLYYAEDGFAAHVKRLMSAPINDKIPEAELMKIIGLIEEEEVLSYGQEQFTAIERALHAKLMILTGGPGTGKTTVIKGIIKAYASIHRLSIDPNEYDDKHEFPFILTAPTGRAAKRLTESTGLPAVTIHRLLGWNGNEGFEKNEHEQLTGKFLIVDEFSMVDIWLANHLFKALPDSMQVLLVGDEDQLPSVGPGQVLTDLLESQTIPFVSLKDVYRQKEGSKIIQLAHMIKSNQCSRKDLKNDADFSFIDCHEHHVIDAITSIFTKAKKKGIDLADIQVLAPMYRSQAGITMINKALQELINPKSKQRREVQINDIVFRVGDKVIQLVNQPENGVYNGDIGEIVAVFEEDENVDNVEQMVVSFDEKEVVFERKDYVNIMHAYCISIHKSQGSEFPIVLMPIVSRYRRMLRKNLIYTAITRSKRSLIICGEKSAFLQGINTLDTNKRFTTLQDQLLSRLAHIATEEIDEVGSADDISPYDFM